MLEAVKGTAAQARYVVFDCWFSSPSVIISISKLGYHVVARLKNNENFRYKFRGENASISRIYYSSKNRRGRPKRLLSALVEVRHKDIPDSVPARIVYVRERANTGNWIALISTDLSLSEDEIVALYGKRWDIEPFHKVIKSCLHLETEFQLRSYDSMTAHTIIVMVRYIFLALENRENIDWRSVNDGFYILCAELDDISFSYVFGIILAILKSCLHDDLHLPEELVDALVNYFLSCLPCHIKDKIRF